MMEGTVYSHLGMKRNRTYQEKRGDEVLTLKDFLEHKWTLHNADEVKKTVTRELKGLLQKENIFDFINAFFELETDLHQVIDSLEFEVDMSFDEFYKNLSPVIMRSILENSSRPDDAKLILKSVKESLRIALEEELYRLEEPKF
ncbi:MAG: hypothetical protein KBD76_00620 [Bacteriovorax sp.]|nr:hypothetical protein [Bacteriovorax sp.]